ncbi:MAG: YIP1 family protein [Desulfuromonadales bacterium]|nr:YIP1 family protein [Desulfuromonadales bacterium]
MPDHNKSSDLQSMAQKMNGLLNSVAADMLAIIIKPAHFFKNMPKTGGFAPPLLFMMIMALLTAVVIAVLGLIGAGYGSMMIMGFMGIVILPVMVAIFGFVGAAILFVIWKIMGSDESYETAYRCIAYSYAYAPLAALLSIIPYLGTVVGALWPMALMALASIHVHHRKQNLSWAVFGIFGLILALSSLGMEAAGGKMQESAASWQQQFDNNERTPEEAGKAVGEFLKGLQNSQKE